MEDINSNLRSMPVTGRGSKIVIHIGGIPVEFPFQAYGTQLAFMNRVISTLDRSQREGHCHALLESPTGTGKTLSLLCSALAWQQNQKLKNLQEVLTHSSSRADPEAMTDPINHGGGFIPETQSSGNPPSPPPATNNSKKEKKRATPTIFYSSRTHAQLSQAIREYRKTTYRVPMAVLGSRRHYCTNSYIRGTDNLDEQCKLLLKNREDSCPEYKNVNKVKSHPSIQKGGCHEVHDIEDLVKIGQVVKGCSYFAARSMAQDAELVFCPYNYIMHPLIRDAMEVDITKSVIIFDEAHNIEDIARDAGSVDLDEEALIHLQSELMQLSLNDGDTYQPLFEMTQDILSWIGRRVPTLTKREFQRYCCCWTGDKALKELREANLTLQNYTILYECARKAIRTAVEAEPDTVHLTGRAVITLEGFFSALNYFFAGNGTNTSNYELALQRFVKKDEGGWTKVLSLWCLNPAVVFGGITELSQSVILTSGTLSPLASFSSELGVQFGACLEAPHVIDVDSQVWAAAISNGPGNYPLNASYKTADEYAFQDAVGKSLEEICKVVPGGCLVFFPSYKLLDKMSSRWQGTGLWARLNAQKSIFVEPRNSRQDSFDSVLREYYDSVHCGIRKKPRGKRLGLKNSSKMKSTEDAKKGAAFLAVCRGKVSEGMDFSDDNARAVVVVGIPFPNMYDIKVAQKKKFNDTYEMSKKLLNGNEWYCQQAFRALNQAIGRCIRHRFDYGAIVFLDERFHKERNRVYISKWLRNTIKLYSSFEESLDSLKSFFQNVKVTTGTPVILNENPQANFENTVSVDMKKCQKQPNNRVTQSDRRAQKVVSENIVESDEAAGLAHSSIPIGTYDSISNHAKSEVKHESVSPDYIDLESDPENSLRWSAARDDDDDLEPSVINETPSTNMHTREINSETYSLNDYASSITRQQSTVPLQHSKASPNNSFCSPVNTPQTESRCEENNQGSLSVNSKVRKRRKVQCSWSVSHGHEFHDDVKAPDRPSSLACSPTIADATQRNEDIVSPPSSCGRFKPSQSPKPINSDGSVLPCRASKDGRTRILCSHCKRTLGYSKKESLMENLTTSSKSHLLSLKGNNSKSGGTTPRVEVLVTDKSCLDQHLFLRSGSGSGAGQGIWCKEDGCVYNSIFCPFCAKREQCLGVHIVATDGFNMHLQNKVMLFLDDLVITPEARTKTFGPAKNQGLSPSPSPSPSPSTYGNSKIRPNELESYAYVSTSPKSSGGWRSIRSTPNK